MAKVKMSDQRWYLLRLILNNLSVEQLYNEKLEEEKPSKDRLCKHKYQAVTLLDKIVKRVKLDNKAFEEKVEAAEKIINKFIEEQDALLIKLGLPTNVRGPSKEELIKMMSPEAQAEAEVWRKEREPKLFKEITAETGLMFAQIPTCQKIKDKVIPLTIFLKRTQQEAEEAEKENKQPKEDQNPLPDIEEQIEVEFDDTHKQLEFLREVYSRNIFDVIADKTIALEIGETLGIT